MIGAVIITHGVMAEAILEATESIAGEVRSVRAVAVKGDDSTEDVRARLDVAMKEVDSSDGVIIFTDMFGGTPSNIALSLLKEGKVEVITGVNLPLIIKFINNRKSSDMPVLAEQLAEYGHKSIVLASHMLKGKVK
ncbi:MAG: PTS sugar transporter subunit IIA [Deltaproteobacteria bacterium]|nr:PTS sugar transporter subunit IIA [Deltaproteobacteria bacterium]